jgi:hypothetical protein
MHIIGGNSKVIRKPKCVVYKGTAAMSFETFVTVGFKKGTIEIHSNADILDTIVALEALSQKFQADYQDLEKEVQKSVDDYIEKVRGGLEHEQNPSKDT